MEAKKKSRRGRPADLEGRELIRQLYPTNTPSEIAKMTGRAYSFVVKWARKCGLEHDEATKERIRRQAIHNLTKRSNYAPEILKRRSETFKQLWRKEELRVKYGLQRQTRLRLRTMPTKHRKARNQLLARYGYLYDEETPFCLYYDAETRRAKREKYYIEKYGFEFKEDK